MTKSSPSLSARVCSEARSDPAFGSEYPWHQRINPAAIFGRCSFFCASVPYFSSAGPSIQMPKLDNGERAPIADISSRKTLASAASNPPPPYSLGQSGTVQPLSRIRSNQIRCGSDENLVLRPPQNVSSSEVIGRRISGGQLASSQGRGSRRN